MPRSSCESLHPPIFGWTRLRGQSSPHPHSQEASLTMPFSPHFLNDTLPNGDEGGSKLGIELLAFLLLQLGKRRWLGHAGSVASVRGHGIKSVRNPHNSGQDR